MNPTLAAALDYLRAGFGVLPILPDGTKAPDLPRGHNYLKERPTPEDLHRWFADGTRGIALPGGTVSGNLETLDFETGSIFEEWRDLVEAQAPGLVDRLALARTPGHLDGSRGVHARYRCTAPIPGSMKLASEPDADEWGEIHADDKGRVKTRCLIESRGEGGYAIAPGTPTGCHDSGRTWEHWRGPHITECPDLSPLERSLLLDCARALHRVADPKRTEAPEPTANGRLTPGDDFDRRGNWEFLRSEGWKEVSPGYWRRPGKSLGVSATLGRVKGKRGEDLFYVFSTNADPFQPGHAYGRFRAYALLAHNGDLSAAAGELGRQGFGEPAAPARPKAGEKTAAAAEPLPWPPILEFGVIPPPAPFPICVFPEQIRELTLAYASAMNVPIDFPAVSILAIAGGATANARHARIKRSYSASPCLWIAIVAPPGTTKSPVLKSLANPLDDAQHIYLTDWRRRLKDWKDEGGEGERPAAARCIVRDVTVESLAKLLHESHRGVVMIKDELAGLVLSLNQYKSGGKGADRQNWLELWSGGTLQVDRKSDKDMRGEPLYVRDPFCAILGAIQPDVLDRLRGESRQARDDGFVDRFLFSFPICPPAKEETWEDIPEHLTEEWERIIHYLLSLEMVQEDGGRLRPFFIHLSESGREAWTAFTAAHAHEVNAEDFPESLVSPWAKLKGYCLRLALVIHLLHSACNRNHSIPPIDDESIIRAVELVNYFGDHARRVYCVMGEDHDVTSARRLVQWVRKRGEPQFTRKEIYSAHQGTFRRVEELEPILNLLVAHGFIRLAAEPDKRGRGRPSMVYDVNPEILKN